ncbi:hypothetical protein BRC86_07755 [Halobacteriales archaeon QS_3_64_16]|nr:MAG: hypothetical protein BRC86_07755 [Halobacteriales archaeon QS_3_64_16]
MVEWVASGAGRRALDGERTIALDAPEWYDGDERSSLGSESGAITGTVAGLTVPTPVVLETAAGRRVHSSDAAPIDLPSGEYELSVPALRFDGATRVDDPTANAIGERPVARELSDGTGRCRSLRFSGPARIQEKNGTLSACFLERTPIAIGCRRERPDAEPIVVPKTPAGIATAITHAASAHRSIGPDRSHPALRDHPPLIEFGETTEIPDTVRAGTPETGLRLSMPDSIATLLVAAPLAYYLGATVEVDDREWPVLSEPGGFERRFRSMPAFHHDVAAMLRRVFLLDSLTRTIDPGEVTAAGGSALDRLDIRPGELVDATPTERLERYCEVPSSRLRPELPEWHLSTYVEPTIENARSLPYLLEDLSLLYLPTASELDGKGLLRRSLDDFYRAEDIASVDRLEPELHAGRAHGWLAPGTPIDVFKSSPSAYEHRLIYGDRDPEMSGEHDRVAEIYREGAVDLPANVTVETDLSKRELAAVFEAPNDFVHFIGHCDTGGLCCPDGSFSTSSLDECRTRTFFLNACGSYQEGLGLIEAGSVAGAVTLTAVLNDHAATVGTAFARLLIYGFDIERAIQLARRRIMMGKDYAVVGDGTHALTNAGRYPPTVMWLQECEGTFRATYEVASTSTTGGTYRPPVAEDDRTYLQGVNADIELARAELLSVLRGSPLPVIYDGDFHWSTELADRLDS